MSETVDIDEILEHIGEFGTYQRRIYFLLALPLLFAGALNLSYVFIAAKPNYRCIVPTCESEKNAEYNASFLSFTIPVKNDGRTLYPCSRYAHLNHSPWNALLDQTNKAVSPVPLMITSLPNTQEPPVTECVPKLFSNMTIEDCPDGHVFDKTIYESTIISEFNLTCEAGWEAQFSQSIYFGGMLVGAFMGGIVADWAGRRITIVINLILMAMSGIGTALVPNMTLFNIMRFINAMTSAGTFQTSFVLALEFVGAKYRVPCSIIGQYLFALGEVMLGALGLYFRGWRMLQLLISTPLSIGLLYWFVVPESPRWLQSRGQHGAFRDLMLRVARTNKKPFPEHLFIVNDNFSSESQRLPSSDDEDEGISNSAAYSEAAAPTDVTVTTSSNRGTVVAAATGAVARHAAAATPLVDVPIEDDLTEEDSSRRVTFLQVMQTPVMAVRVISMMLIWLVTTLVYYGLSMNSTDLGMNPSSPNSPYYNFMLTALIEIPGYTMAWILQQTVGRKAALSVSLLLAGTSCIGAGLVYQLPSVHALTASLIGKCGITSAFGIIYLYTAEIFPTSVRNTILGACSTVARLGGMAAPFTNDMSSVYTPLPMLVFGGLCVAATLLALVQPETLGTKLPDTLQQAIMLGKHGAGSSDEEETGPLLQQEEEQDGGDS